MHLGHIMHIIPHDAHALNTSYLKQNFPKVTINHQCQSALQNANQEDVTLTCFSLVQSNEKGDKNTINSV